LIPVIRSIDSDHLCKYIYVVPLQETVNKMQNENKKRFTANQSSALYGMGFIGAAIYFVQHATTFWMGLFGFLKALVWPAVLVYQLFDFLK